MLYHGKHVLCEKPLCVNYRQAQELINYARSKKLFLMEGIWSRFFPSYAFLRDTIDAKALGKIEKVDMNLGFSRVSRYNSVVAKKTAGGGTLHLSVYAFQLALWIFNSEPSNIEVVEGQLNEYGIDIASTVVLSFGDAKVRIESNNIKALDNCATIYGSKGTIKVSLIVRVILRIASFIKIYF